MASTVIEVENVSKSYTINHESGNSGNLRDLITGKTERLFSSAKQTTAAQKEQFMALNNISFNVVQGSRVGIIGSNGAGKSTLLKILSKITEPTQGKINVTGRVVSLLEVGTGFHPELTGRENIFLNGVILGMTRAEIRNKFDEIVEFSEIAQFLDTPVKRYSSGMYMRLAFAVAAHLEPEILIIDEVLSVGDAQFQKKCMVKMDEISRGDGITFLFVSHNIEAVRAFCNTGIYLNKGKLISQGHIDKVADDYALYFNANKKAFKPNTHSPVFFNSVSLSKNNCFFKEDIMVSCEIVCAAEHSRYIIGVSIADNFDHKVGTNLIHSYAPLKKGLNKITLKIPTGTIVPGDYQFTLAIALDEALNNLDVVSDYPAFSILSDNKNQQLFSRWSHSWGGNILCDADLV